MGLLRLRKRVKKKKPDFRRHEYFRHKRLGTKWRKPRGRHSKLKLGRKWMGKIPRPSYSSPRAVRGLDSRGYREVRVFNPKGLEGLDPGRDTVVIGSSVGRAKRKAIIEKAKALNIRVSNS